jgi:hypothetical protein
LRKTPAEERGILMPQIEEIFFPNGPRMPLPKAFEEAIGGAFEKNHSRGSRYFNAANR